MENELYEERERGVNPKKSYFFLFFLVSPVLEAAAALSPPPVLRITSQTQQLGAKKFSLLILCPDGSKEMSFFLMYFCLQRLMKPKGSDI